VELAAIARAGTNPSALKKASLRNYLGVTIRLPQQPVCAWLRLTRTGGIPGARPLVSGAGFGAE
jgi:hypothetical protein